MSKYICTSGQGKEESMSTDDESNNSNDQPKKFYTKTHKDAHLTLMHETVPIKLTFEGLSYSIKTSDKETNQILKPSSGVLIPGQTHFILGASGAGKSTLLNLITGSLNSEQDVGVKG